MFMYYLEVLYIKSAKRKEREKTFRPQRNRSVSLDIVYDRFASFFFFFRL